MNKSKITIKTFFDNGIHTHFITYDKNPNESETVEIITNSHKIRCYDIERAAEIISENLRLNVNKVVEEIEEQIRLMSELDDI